MGAIGRCSRAIAALTLWLGMMGLGSSPTATAALAAQPGGCADYRVPVALLGGLAEAHIAGELCLPGGPPPRTVQVLVPGATYNHIYYDFPVEAQTNSYVRHAMADGHAVFAMDRLDTGASDQVTSALVTIDVDAASVSRVVAALRAGRVGGVRFSKVVVVGHSLGSIVAAEEAAVYHDVDGVILSGFTHFLSPPFSVALASGQLLIPAQSDPRFAHRPLGELAVPPPARIRWFSAPGAEDPAVIAEDQATRDAFAAGELATFAEVVPGVSTNLIRAPVLLAEASRDAAFYCGLVPCANSQAVLATERLRFTGSPSLQAYVLSGSGHDLDLARNAPLFFAAANSWVDAHVGG